ncbi:MAG: hypothetical protein COA84_13805 [Robiginitomaculum sp.]|nr:MAG: hypothetical protein COA84_13805 [Robiginitomaculum sp.]
MSNTVLSAEEFKEFNTLKLMFKGYMSREINTYFVCGEGGERDRLGLPEYLTVCPAFGSDLSFFYKRVDKDI